MSSYFLFAILLLGFVITFQIAKASEYVGILKGEKKNNESNNRINGFLMIVFLVLGLIGVYWCNELFRGKILGKLHLITEQKIDQMLYITIADHRCRIFYHTNPSILVFIQIPVLRKKKRFLFSA